jgi:hypothetical protein
MPSPDQRFFRNHADKGPGRENPPSCPEVWPHGIDGPTRGDISRRNQQSIRISPTPIETQQEQIIALCIYQEDCMTLYLCRLIWIAHDDDRRRTRKSGACRPCPSPFFGRALPSGSLLGGGVLMRLTKVSIKPCSITRSCSDKLPTCEASTYKGSRSSKLHPSCVNVRRRLRRLLPSGSMVISPFLASVATVRDAEL